MISIDFPCNCIAERTYIVEWIFGEVFGLEYRLMANEEVEGRWVLGNDSVPGKKIEFPDVFFSQARGDWLGRDTLPEMPLRQCQGLPALYGNEQEIDVLGSLFFLLSRYEESVIEERDEHDRVPSSATILGREGLLHRALGNEYIEAFWGVMQKVWPGLRRRSRSFRVMPSHDMDSPSKSWKTWRRTLRASFHRLRKGHLREGGHLLWQRLFGQRFYSWRDDPWDTVSWLLEVSEAEGWKSTFYYIPEQTHPYRDPGMPIDHGHVIDQWNRIAAVGHQLGVHPGYETYDHPERIASSVRRLRHQMGRLGIEQDAIGGRQHYLRWQSPTTARAYEAAGLAHDASIGFADTAGFRAGICYEYPFYDVVKRRPLTLRERPLVLMDVSLIRQGYMGLGLGAEGYDYAHALKQECRRFGGDFSVLWHNENLEDEESREFYTQLLKS